MHRGQVGQPSPEPDKRTAPPVTTIPMLATREPSARRRRVTGVAKNACTRLIAFTATWYDWSSQPPFAEQRKRAEPHDHGGVDHRRVCLRSSVPKYVTLVL